MIRADGSAAFLTGGRGLPLGVVAAEVPRAAASCPVGPGDLIVLFTDGLYERRDEVLDVRPGEVARQAARFRHRSPTELSRELSEAMPGRRPAEDDICVLVAAVD